MIATERREMPILFAPDLAQKVAEGVKTQTRRPLKFKMWKDDPVVEIYANSGFAGDPPNKPPTWNAEHRSGNGTILVEQGITLPYRVGDLLYVRETWGTIKEYDRLPPREIPVGASIGFKTDPIGKWCQTGCNGAAGKWRPSIHMPKWAARTWVEVTKVRVERIQWLMEGDALAEGYAGATMPSASDEFWSSWDARYPGSLQRNDWVAVYDFKKVERP